MSAKSACKANTVFHGIGISNGKAGGVLRFFKRQTEIPSPSSTASSPPVSPILEGERLKKALDQARKEISALRRRTAEEIGEKEAEIFEIHAMLLEDEDFTEGLDLEISSGSSAEDAVRQTSQKYAQALQELNDPYLAARTADIQDIAKRLLRILSGKRETARQDETQPYILVADDLTPSETVTLKKELILGFVTFGGTPNSHTSILARAMGIPALVGVGELDADALDGVYAILDAASGSLTASPDERKMAEFQKSLQIENEIAKEHDRYLRTLVNKPAVTRGGRRILIYANAGSDAEAEAANLNGAEGIGLLRSEFLYLSLDRYPTENELFSAYCDVLRKMKGKRVVIRTLDIGADKRISYFDLPEEINPAMGFRAVRICLARERIFKTQLRAILRASAMGSVSIMIPMIISVEEVRRCRTLLEECKKSLAREGKSFDAQIEFGIMIETPAAAVMSRELAAEVDFFSVGTNDLTQYTLAVDRQNPLVANLTEKNQEPVLRLIEAAARDIHESGGWIGICGEMAADLRLTQRFADMGIDELSVSPPYLLGVREKVTECK